MAPVVQDNITHSDRYELRIVGWLRTIIQAFDVHSRKLSAAYGVTGPQLVCLLTVVDHDGITAREISKIIHSSPSTLVGILDRLESKGLIARQRDGRDRRQVRISATEEGRSFVERVPSPLDERLRSSLVLLSKTQQAEIARALQRLAEMIDVPGQLDHRRGRSA